jgi:hypothetical protein
MFSGKKLVFLSLMVAAIPCYSQGIDYKLVKIDAKQKGFCTIYFDVTNNTNLNVTGGWADITLREADGSIINKQQLLYKRIKKGETDAVESIGAHSCGDLKIIQLKMTAVDIDGDLYAGARQGSERMISLANGGKRTSSIKGVTLK